MTVGDRFKGWIDSAATGWGPRLGGWMMSWFSGGVIKFIETIEPEGLDFIDESLAGIADNPLVPAPLRNMIAKIRRGGHPLPLLVLIPLAVLMFLPIINNLFAPVGRLLEQQVDQLVRSFRFDPGSVIAAWRRNPAKNAPLLGDLRDAGWSPDRIETLKEITEIIPGVSDLVRMSVREAFSPEIAEKFGQYQDPPTAVYPWAEKLGLSKEWVDRYWAAHWELPSSGQGFELLHRGIITEADLKLLLRALDVMPYWRDKLINISWAVPTRVDVRRFWDMRTIDEARLREVYTAIGYHGKDLDDYVLWTKIFTDFPDLLARYKNGWITLARVREELVAMGMKPERADTLIEEKIKKAAPERVAAEKDLTKADIIAGVKKNVITREQAAELLVDIGYSNDEAVYLLDVNIPADEETSVKTARELTKSDILAGLKAGVITEQDALNKLLELRYTANDADFLLKVYKSAVKPPEEAKLKEASKADIVTAVKKGLITQEAAYMMLLDIGFSADGALFILSVAAEESPFSPVTFDEFKDQTQKYRLAAGMEGKPMTEEIKKLGAQVVRLSGEVAALERSIKAEQGTMIQTEGLPAAATARLKELQSALYKAQSELARVRTDYNAKVAEWRHAAG